MGGSRGFTTLITVLGYAGRISTEILFLLILSIFPGNLLIFYHPVVLYSPFLTILTFLLIHLGDNISFGSCQETVINYLVCPSFIHSYIY